MTEPFARPAVPKLEGGVYLVLRRKGNQLDVTEMRKNRPAMKAGEIAVKINLAMARELFEQFIPTVSVEIEAGEVIEPSVEVEPAPVAEEPESLPELAE